MKENDGLGDDEKRNKNGEDGHVLHSGREKRMREISCSKSSDLVSHGFSQHVDCRLISPHFQLEMMTTCCLLTQTITTVLMLLMMMARFTKIRPDDAPFRVIFSSGSTSALGC